MAVDLAAVLAIPVVIAAYFLARAAFRVGGRLMRAVDAFADAHSPEKDK